FRGKGTALFGHETPRSGEHSRLNGCPVSLDHYTKATHQQLKKNRKTTRQPKSNRQLPLGADRR
ncbi:hypothetical protein, partial [Pseudomonas gelidaquae]|uniref:hypothetical protein n=2 Tax=unclassified Pseudomonas TaxID=196821 RepID=UPI001C4819A9